MEQKRIDRFVGTEFCMKVLGTEESIKVIRNSSLPDERKAKLIAKLEAAPRSVGRAVYCCCLENSRPRKGTEGSNPSHSAPTA